MEKYTVLVTRIINKNVLAKLKTHFNLIVNEEDVPLSRTELKIKVKDVDAILCFLNDKIDKEIMSIAGPSLKIISTFSTGFEHIDVDEASKRGIKIGYTGNILTETTADLAFGLMLSMGRRIVEADKYVRNLNWRLGWSPNLMIGSDIHNKTIGIIGMGKIGLAITRRALGFNMRILYTKRKKDLKNNIEVSLMKLEYCTIENLLSESDYVMICCTLNKDSYHMINYKRLQLMKESAFLINIARGQVIDEKDLIISLQEGKLAGAALDVYEKEPIMPDNPLLKMENVILLPHIGSASKDTRNKMAEIAVSNIISVLHGDGNKAILLN